MDRLDWNLLRTFQVIVQMQSISSASARLHITQSAVSQALRRLETQLDRKLIERSGGHFYLTTSGRHVYEIAEAVNGDISRLQLLLSSVDNDVVGEIKVLAASRIQSDVYDRFWANFRARYPAINVHLDVMRSDDIIDTLRNATATIGIGLAPRPIKGLERYFFLRQRYAMFCGKGHHLFSAETTRLEDLANEDFVSFSSDIIGGSLSPLTIFRDQHGFTGKVIATSPNYDEIVRLLIAGYGIGCLPRHSAGLEVDRGRLRMLPPEDGICDVELHMLWKKDALTLAGQAFVDEFIRYMDDHDDDERARCSG
ncbi:LysR family transcriptional regulator [Halomonas cupida]|uniref:LysR family transcriptional regulator n=1 Tax=Halomonas cupida TaxID=44933 RepID=UPI0039B5547A